MNSQSNPFTREAGLQRLEARQQPWDVIVIGGGATGVGIALDAASRELDVLLVEQSDFGKGTSSRSTKLVHGGVRYLKQGNLTLVRDALRERTLLKRNAPHLVHDLSFLIPCASRWERFFYGTGLKLYDFLAWGDEFGTSAAVAKQKAIELAPSINPQGLHGGVLYHDGQFDDARLLINMARTASDQGACLLNYVAAKGLMKTSDGSVCGVEMEDAESGRTFEAKARSVVNAAGPFCDAVRELDQPDGEKMLSVSQGVHLVVQRKHFPSDVALMVPKTSDGRVIFIIPWHDHVLIGTTDTEIDRPELEPRSFPQEIEFLLETSSRFLASPLSRADVRSVFVGIRPLVKGDRSAKTASLSRDHVIRESDSGLITIAGGKWTTVRKMSEDCVDHVVKQKGLHAKPCQTESLKIHGSVPDGELPVGPRAYYGSDLKQIEAMEATDPGLSGAIVDGLPLSRCDVRWAVQQEMARQVEDVLARRSRTLVLDSQAALAASDVVAQEMAALLNKDAAWISQQRCAFEELALKCTCPKNA